MKSITKDIYFFGTVAAICFVLTVTATDLFWIAVFGLFTFAFIFLTFRYIEKAQKERFRKLREEQATLMIQAIRTVYNDEEERRSKREAESDPKKEA